jgi:hypothetical protein
MVFWNLLDSGPSHSGLLLEPSESLRGGTPGTNPRQVVASKKKETQLQDLTESFANM